MIIVTGLVEVAEVDREAAISLAMELAIATRQEPGCLTYGFYEDIGERGRMRVYEEWENEAALERHFSMPHMVRFAEAMSDIEITAMAIEKFEAGPRSPI